MSLWLAYDSINQIIPIKPNPGFKLQLMNYEQLICDKSSIELDSFGNWKEKMSPQA